MADWRPILELFDAIGPVVVTTHINPDGDAIGSELALAAWLRASGREVTILNSDPVPSRYAFLNPAAGCGQYRAEEHEAVIRKAETAVILDVARQDRLGAVGEVFAASSARRVVIDHHPVEGTISAEVVLIDPTAAATGELLFEMMEAAGRPPDDEMAVALYVAIMTDTGSFRYANTTPRTHLIAAELLKHRIDTAGIYEKIYETSSERRLRLLGLCLTRMEVLAGGAVVFLSVTQEFLSEAGAVPQDSEGFVEFVRGMEGCRVAAVFNEWKPGEAKVSLRSKGAIDVNRIARKWGGGGHQNAAGIPLQPGMAELKRSLAEALTEAVKTTPAG